MCISPSFYWLKRGAKWVKQPKGCGKCWRCERNWLNDYIGRCLAEASTSEVACTVSLTYAPRDDLADKILHPKHFQLFIKLLRNAGHKVRYIAAGEYGDLKGRAHFHAVLFFKRLVPLDGRGMAPRYKDDYPEGSSQADAPFCREIPQKRMVHIREWPHGHIICDWSMTHRSVRYVCAYVRQADKNNSWFTISKKPPIGHEWFMRRAAKYRELGVLPSSFEYLPPGGDPQRPYLMTGATRRDFIKALNIDAERVRQMSEFVQRGYEKTIRDDERAAAEPQMVGDDTDPLDWFPRYRAAPDRAHVERVLQDKLGHEFVSWWKEGDAQLDVASSPSAPYASEQVQPEVNHGQGKASLRDYGKIHNPKPRAAPVAVYGGTSGVERPGAVYVPGRSGYAGAGKRPERSRWQIVNGRYEVCPTTGEVAPVACDCRACEAAREYCRFLESCAAHDARARAGAVQIPPD